MRSNVTSEHNLRRTRGQFTETNTLLQTRSMIEAPTPIPQKPKKKIKKFPIERQSLPDNVAQSVLKSLKVPRSFWKDIYGEENTYFLTQTKYDRKQQEGELSIQKDNQSIVEQVITGVNKAVHKLRTLRQFKSELILNKVDNRSEESVDEKHIKKEDSFNKAIRRNTVYNSSTLGQSLMRSTQATWQMQSKTENEMEQLEQTLDALIKTYNHLKDEEKNKQNILQMLQLKLNKLTSGGKSERQLMKSKREEKNSIEYNIQIEQKKLQETYQEYCIFQNMLLERKQDQFLMFGPYLSAEKKLKLLNDVVVMESENLANHGNDLQNLRFKIQLEGESSDQTKRAYAQQSSYRKRMIEKETIVRSTFYESIQQNQKLQNDKELATSRLQQDIQIADGQSTKIYQIEFKRNKALEDQFHSLNGVILVTQKPENFESYFWKLQEDKRLMLEKCSTFERQIETTKEETSQIQQQFSLITTERLELDENDTTEVMLETQDIISKLEKELSTLQYDIAAIQSDFQQNQLLFSTISKGFYCMIAQNANFFKEKMPPTNLTVRQMKIDKLTEYYHKCIESLQEGIQNQNDPFENFQNY